MAKQGTSEEYLPPWPEDLPTKSFAKFERILRKGQRPVLDKGECLSQPLRQYINKAAYLLIDGMHRHDARPKAKLVVARLDEVIEVIQQSIVQDSLDWLRPVLTLLRKDGVGEVVQSLLPPLSPPHVPPISLSREVLLVRQWDFLKEVLLIRRRQQCFYDRDGVQPASYRDVLILAMAQIYKKLGAKPVAYHVQRAEDHSRFVKLIRAVAREAVRCFAPELSGNSAKRRLLRANSLNNLAIKILRSERSKKVTGQHGCSVKGTPKKKVRSKG